MNQQILRSKFLLFIVFFIIVLMFVAITNSASAAKGKGYFSGKDACTTNYKGDKTCDGSPSMSKNDVLSGRPSAIPSSAQNKKDKFIVHIKDKLKDGDRRDKDGAAFIINTMVNAGTPGNPGKKQRPGADMIAEWEARINNPDITMSVVSGDPNKRGDGKVSFYDPNINDDFFASYKTGSTSLLLFKSKGTVVYVLEIPCANPVGGLPGLPASQPQWSITADTTVNGAKDIKVRFGTTVNFSSYIYNQGPDGLDRNVNGDMWLYKPGQPGFWADGTSLDLWPGYAPGSQYARTRNVSFTPNDTDKRCGNVWTDVQAWNNLNARWWSEACVTGVPPPDPATISPISTPSGNYEKGGPSQTFTVGVNIAKQPCDELNLPGSRNQPIGTVNYRSTSNLGGPTINGSVQLLNCGDPISPTLSVNSVDSTVLDQQLPSVSETRTTEITSAPGGTVIASNPKSSSVTVYEVPYARFYGQDIYATGEGATPNGTIFFNTNTAGSAGSASQYAAIAKNLISGAANGIKINTAAFRGSSPSPNDGLKAKWTSAPTADVIYNKVVENLKTPATTGSFDYSNNSISGRITNAATADINITDNIVGGDINNNVTLVADGNIYIHPKVTRIDAVLIAKGTVYTCATSDSLPSRGNWQNLPTDTPAGCRNTLTINGAVSAKNIKFQRSVGTRLMAGVDEDSGSAGKVNIESRGGGNNSTAAEVINYPAYLNFSSLDLDDTSDNSYQAIFNVPPYL